MSDRLNPDESPPLDGSLTSQDGRFTFVMQSDGNLVLYRIGGPAKWATGTDGRAVGQLIMQGDSNLVMYDPVGTPLWASNTDGHVGAFLLVQNDGNVVIYDPDGSAPWATGTNIVSVRVPGFLPSTNGLHFKNSFPNAPDFSINVLGAMIAIGNAANGLCGGMTYTVRDLFEAGMPPPPDTTGPTSGPLFNYIVRRLFDSFELPFGPAIYMALMNPALPDHETVASNIGLAPRGRAWIMINQEWPKIKADLDGGRLSAIALVLIKSASPGDMGNNHQVLAYGYDLDRNDLNIRIYDPNCENQDDKWLSLNISDPQHTTIVTKTCQSLPVFCFFRTNYTFSAPPSFASIPTAPDPKLTVNNRTGTDQTIRVFNTDDSMMLIALTAGEFVVEPGMSADWIFQAGLSDVKLTANGRPLGVAMPGDTIFVDQDDRVIIRNLSSNEVTAKFYNVGDRLMWFTLPDGDRNVSPMSDLFYTVPPDLNQVKVILGGNAITANLGDVIVFNP